MEFLLDSSALIALVDADHEHHRRAESWASRDTRLVLCPISEGALVRYIVRRGRGHRAATAVVSGLRESSRVAFVPDELSYGDVDLGLVIGHRQVTDAYLVSLARSRPDTKLATFDASLASLYPKDTLLIPEV